MAVWTQLKKIRLKLKDPGVIAAILVDAFSDLPVSPQKQTAYKVEDTGKWYLYDYDMMTFAEADLRIADETLEELIDEYGETKATAEAIDYIIAGLYQELQLVKMSSGSEAMEYVRLKEAVEFYQAIKKSYVAKDDEEKRAGTARLIKTQRPTIGGMCEW